MTSLLLIATSARMLAHAAKKSGFTVLVIDLFADLDTQDYATDYRQVKSLSEEDLKFAVEYFIKRYAVAQVIYGSGFESYPESLDYLASRLLILGNRPQVFKQLLNKRAFFERLAQLNIAYPQVVYAPPAFIEGWLLKPIQGQGGVGIHYYQANDGAKKSVYWQRFQAGMPHSILFVADGQALQVIGFNRQWSVCLSKTQAFVFSGISNETQLTDEQKQKIIGWLAQLVPILELKGLNSLDFIQDENNSYVLEINPRPSASMQLYDDNVLAKHINSISGTLSPEVTQLKFQYTGYQIVYADSDVSIPEQFIWPQWCSDLPAPGNICHTGQPICSIIAHKNEAGAVNKQLLTRQQLILNTLHRF